jgi:hypothetical protein
MKYIVLILTLLSSILFFSCSKEDTNDNVTGNCLVTKLYIPGTDTGQSSSKYRWDAQDRPIFWDFGGPGDLVYTYLPGKIVMSATNENSPTTFYLSADSTAYMSTWYLQGNRMDSALYYYNSEKQLIKTVRYTDAFGKDSIQLTWSNGNIIRIDMYNANGTHPKAEMEYTDLPQKSFLYQHFQPFIGTNLYLPWLGKPNKNLTKVVRSEFNGMPDPVSITYDLYESGYIRSASATFMGQSNQYVYEYNCR